MCIHLACLCTAHHLLQCKYHQNLQLQKLPKVKETDTAFPLSSNLHLNALEPKRFPLGIAIRHVNLYNHTSAATDNLLTNRNRFANIDIVTLKPNSYSQYIVLQSLQKE